MGKKEDKANEYAQIRYGCNNGNKETQNEIAKFIACRVGFEAGWDEALKNQWISVEERLPELNERVLVAQHGINRISICIMKRIPHDSSNHANKEWHWSLTNDKSEIIAWMPIPSFDDILKQIK